MATMSAKEIKIMREILAALNEEFPPQPIPVTIWKDGKLIKTVTTQDQHFNAYKDYRGINCWWITCNNYDRWEQSYPYLNDFCKLFKLQTGITCHPCHTHPVFDAAKKRQFKEKKTCFWIGNLTWTK